MGICFDLRICRFHLRFFNRDASSLSLSNASADDSYHHGVAVYLVAILTTVVATDCILRISLGNFPGFVGLYLDNRITAFSSP